MSQNRKSQPWLLRLSLLPLLPSSYLPLTSQYRNAIERTNGHLWQSRYYSCAVDPGRLAAVMRYVELNPVRAGIASRADLYRWSSARAHATGEPAPHDSDLLAGTDWSRCWTPPEWSTILESGSDGAAEIRDSTYSGRPLGSGAFVEELERHLGRRLIRGQPGRPRKIDGQSRNTAI